MARHLNKQNYSFCYDDRASCIKRSLYFLDFGGGLDLEGGPDEREVAVLDLGGLFAEDVAPAVDLRAVVDLLGQDFDRNKLNVGPAAVLHVAGLEIEAEALDAANSLEPLSEEVIEDVGVVLAVGLVDVGDGGVELELEGDHGQLGEEHDHGDCEDGEEEAQVEVVGVGVEVAEQGQVVLDDVEEGGEHQRGEHEHADLVYHRVRLGVQVVHYYYVCDEHYPVSHPLGVYVRDVPGCIER